MSTGITCSRSVGLDSENVVSTQVYMVEKNSCRSDTERREQLLESDNRSNDTADDSEKECLDIGSHDSDTETSSGVQDYDKERFTEKGSTGCGDRLTESTHSEPSRCKANVRHRCHQDCQTEMIFLESSKQDLVPKEISFVNSGYTDMETESISGDVISDRQVATTDGNTSLWDWFIYFASRIISIIFLSIIYLGFAILSIKILHLSTKKA